MVYHRGTPPWQSRSDEGPPGTPAGTSLVVTGHVKRTCDRNLISRMYQPSVKPSLSIPSCTSIQHQLACAHHVTTPRWKGPSWNVRFRRGSPVEGPRWCTTGEQLELFPGGTPAWHPKTRSDELFWGPPGTTPPGTLHRGPSSERGLSVRL